MATVYRLSWKLNGFDLPNPACSNCQGSGDTPLFTGIGTCACVDSDEPIERHYDYEYLSLAIIHKLNIEGYEAVSDVRVETIAV